MEEQKTYQLPAEGKLIEVTKEQYSAFYKHKRREKYLEERDKAHRLHHYSDLDTDEILGEEMFSYPDEVGVEELGLAQATVNYHRNRIISALKEKMNIL